MSAPTVTSPQPSRPVADVEPRSDGLAGEHAALLRDVRRRAEPVLALAAARTWPHAELRTLTGFLRSAVLRQASDEEVLMYPHGASAPFAELSAEHVRLYALTEQLDRADRTTCPLPELRRLLEQLLCLLEQHLRAEQAVLAALPHVPVDVPGTADLAAGTQSWPAADDGPVLILLDALPEGQAVQMCIERLLRLLPGQSAEIHSSQEYALQRVCRWIHGFDAARYGIARPPAVPGQSVLRVTRRQLT